MKTILIIEDQWDIRENVAELLELTGYKVLMSDGGAVGIKTAREHLPDLILCDIAMPEIDGFEVLKKLKSHTSTACIPFIFLTARSEKNDMNTGLSLGADDYLIKPFDEEELLAAIGIQFEKTRS